MALAYQMGAALGSCEYEDESGLIRCFGNTTGFKGVVKDGEKFVAKITTGAKLHHLGRYDTAEEAATVYKEASQNGVKQGFALAYQMGALPGSCEYEDESGLVRSFKNTTGFKGVCK